MRTIVLAVLAALAFAPSAAAAPPPNDARASAQPLPALPATATGSTAESTLETGDPQCGAPMSGTVWYRVDRSDDRTVVVGFHADGDLDAVVGAFERTRTGLRALRCDLSDAKGNAGFSFDAHRGGSYLILVGRRANSADGTFRLDVDAPPPPPNDDRAAARPIPRLPVRLAGTTVGASAEENDPRCGESAGTVWYRLDRDTAGPVVVNLRANGDLDATVAVYRRVRSQIVAVRCDQTDRKGLASFAFDGEKDATYLIVVAQLARSVPGTFSLALYAPEPAAKAPGAALPRRGAHATVDPLVDREDAYALRMDAGSTYRINLVARGDRCLRLDVFRPGTREFESTEPVRELYCGGYTTFTPGPDGGGLYSLVVRAGEGKGAQAYRLLAAPAGPDDVGPGLPLASGETRRGSLSGGGIDAVDLYRFEVANPSEVDVSVGSRAGFGATVLAEHGRRLAAVTGKARIRLRPGTYFVALRAGKAGGRYSLRVLVREITATHVELSSRSVAPRTTVTLAALVAPPSASGGRVRIEVDYLDPLAGWVFSRLFTARVAAGGGRVAWTPPKIGRWRVKAVFLGNGAASPSESGYRIVDVR
jgi:hypothetical protein